MAFRFRRRIKIAPGLSLNLGKKGVSVSAGVRGAHVTTGTSGTRVSAGVPGTGLSVTSKVGAGRKRANSEDVQDTPAPQPPLIVRIIIWAGSAWIVWWLMGPFFRFLWNLK